MGKVGRLRKMWHLPTPGATAALSAPQRPETTRLFAGGSGSSWPVPESCEDDFDCNDGSLVFLKWKWCMGVSKNRGTPKWMVYNGKPYYNGWFGGTPIFGNIRIEAAIPGYLVKCGMFKGLKVYFETLLNFRWPKELSTILLNLAIMCGICCF